VQRNFPCVFKSSDDRPYEVYARLLDNVSYLRPDLVVLAESALCEFGPVDQGGAVEFAYWVAEKTGAALLAGLAVGCYASLDEIKEIWRADRTFTAAITAEEREQRKQGWSRAVSRTLGWKEA
jgi:hypothetical protein